MTINQLRANEIVAKAIADAKRAYYNNPAYKARKQAQANELVKQAVKSALLGAIRTGVQAGYYKRFEGYAVVWDKKTTRNSVFTKSTNLGALDVPMPLYWQHESFDGQEVGSIEQFISDDYGLLTCGVLDITVKRGANLWDELRRGDFLGLSIADYIFKSKQVKTKAEANPNFDWTFTPALLGKGLDPADFKPTGEHVYYPIKEVSIVYNDSFEGRTRIKPILAKVLQ